MTEIRFVADVMVGKLARWLRVLGFDVAYSNAYRDDEIIAIDTTNGAGGTVWRFAHHRSAIGSDSNAAQPYFWYEPIANISPDGKWVIFTSNWEKTLGADSSEGTARQDVFVVGLTPLR